MEIACRECHEWVPIAELERHAAVCIGPIPFGESHEKVSYTPAELAEAERVRKLLADAMARVPSED